MTPLHLLREAVAYRRAHLDAIRRPEFRPDRLPHIDWETWYDKADAVVTELTPPERTWQRIVWELEAGPLRADDLLRRCGFSGRQADGSAMAAATRNDARVCQWLRRDGTWYGLVDEAGDGFVAFDLGEQLCYDDDRPMMAEEE